MNYDWIAFCDICGQRYKASQMTPLSNYTGKGGLVVCRHDVDKIDAGLVPFRSRKEQNVPYIRVNHTDVSDSSPIFDYETDTVEQISSYQFIAPSQLDNVVIAASQDENMWIASSQGI